MPVVIKNIVLLKKHCFNWEYIWGDWSIPGISDIKGEALTNRLDERFNSQRDVICWSMIVMSMLAYTGSTTASRYWTFLNYSSIKYRMQTFLVLYLLNCTQCMQYLQKLIEYWFSDRTTLLEQTDFLDLSYVVPQSSQRLHKTYETFTKEICWYLWYINRHLVQLLHE